MGPPEKKMGTSKVLHTFCSWEGHSLFRFLVKVSFAQVIASFVQSKWKPMTFLTFEGWQL